MKVTKGREEGGRHVEEEESFIRRDVLFKPLLGREEILMSRVSRCRQGKKEVLYVLKHIGP